MYIYIPFLLPVVMTHSSIFGYCFVFDMQIAGRDSLWQELQCTGIVPIIIYVARWKPDPGHPEQNDIVMNSFAVSLCMFQFWCNSYVCMS